MDIFDKITQLAKEKGLSLAYICRSLGYEESYLRSASRRYKKSGGQHHGLSSQTIVAIANLLGTTEDYLLGKTNNPQTPSQMSRMALAAELRSSIELSIRTEIAKAMLSDDVISHKAVAKYTGLSEDDIKKLATKN